MLLDFGPITDVKQFTVKVSLGSRWSSMINSNFCVATIKFANKFSRKTIIEPLPSYQYKIIIEIENTLKTVRVYVRNDS